MRRLSASVAVIPRQARAAVGAVMALQVVSIGMAGGGPEFGAAISEQDTTTALAFATLEAEGARSVAAETAGRTVSGTTLVDQVSRIAAGAAAFAVALALLVYEAWFLRYSGKPR